MGCGVHERQKNVSSRYLRVSPRTSRTPTTPNIHKHKQQERHPDLQAEQEARAAKYRAAAKAVKREQERLVRVLRWVNRLSSAGVAGFGWMHEHQELDTHTHTHHAPTPTQQEKEERKRREEEAKLRSYDSLMAEANMESNKKRAATADVSAALELEDDFM